MIPKVVNKRWVTLISKIVGVIELKDFRPIGTVGSIYEIIEKFKALRLKKMMSSLVGETKSAFIMDRQILDGVHIANEVLQWTKRKKVKIFFDET